MAADCYRTQPVGILKTYSGISTYSIQGAATRISRSPEPLPVSLTSLYAALPMLVERYNTYKAYV